MPFTRTPTTGAPKTQVNGMMNALTRMTRKASPYLLIELLLPGGSVIALLLWLFRHRAKNGTGLLGTP